MARPKSEEKYEAIMRATLELVAELGFHGISMAKIAKRAGVATATIYVYFDNTDAILNQLYMDLKQRVAKDLLKGYKPYMSAEEGFRIIWRNQFDSLTRYSQEYWFLEQFGASPYITHISREEGMRQFQPVMDFFRNAMEKGEIRKMPMEIVPPMFFPPLSALAKTINAGHVKDKEKAIQLAMDSSWNAFKPD